MTFLHRHLAPVAERTWEELDEEARSVLRMQLAARRLVDFQGPKGWPHSAVSSGRVREIAAEPWEGVRAAQREVHPLVELRSPFELEREELEALERGARDADLEPLVRAATAIAAAEDRCVFHGFEEVGMRGVVQASPHAPLTLAADRANAPAAVAQALERLASAGVAGPYAIALGPRIHAELLGASDPHGNPVHRMLKRIVGGPIVRAPALEGAVVLSTRGGDFELTVGRDLSIRYVSHDARTLRLELVESLFFRVLAPEAAVPLEDAAR